MHNITSTKLDITLGKKYIRDTNVPIIKNVRNVKKAAVLFIILSPCNIENHCHQKPENCTGNHSCNYHKKENSNCFEHNNIIN